MILVIDDEYYFAKLLKQKLEKYYLDKEIKILTEFDFDFLNTNNIEVLFLDIELDNANGIDLASKYREQVSKDLDIVFVSDYENFEHDTWIAFPICFVRKSKLDNDLAQCMRVLERRNRRRNAKIKIENETIKIKDILYVSSKRNYVYFNLVDNRKVKHRAKISAIEKTLKEYYFVRCHLSFIINVAYIENINRDFTVLKSNNRIPISNQKRYEDVLQAYVDYRFREDN